jgi:hypothetical protein
MSYWPAERSSRKLREVRPTSIFIHGDCPCVARGLRLVAQIMSYAGILALASRTVACYDSAMRLRQASQKRTSRATPVVQDDGGRSLAAAWRHMARSGAGMASALRHVADTGFGRATSQRSPRSACGSVEAASARRRNGKGWRCTLTCFVGTPLRPKGTGGLAWT